MQRALVALLFTTACGRTFSEEDPGQLCITEDGSLRVVAELGLRYGCDDEVLTFTCDVTVQGDALEVTSFIEWHEGPGGCSAYDNTFDPVVECETPADAADLLVSYQGETAQQAELPSCSEAF